MVHISKETVQCAVILHFLYAIGACSKLLPPPRFLVVHIDFVHSFLWRNLFLFLLSGSGGLTPPPPRENYGTMDFMKIQGAPQNV